MWYQINDIDIKLDFNEGIKVFVTGPDKYYYVNIQEYKNDSPLTLYSNHINSGKNPNFFELPIQFFMDFEINIYRLILNYGIVNIFSHRYNDTGKVVKFILNTEYYDEATTWLESINRYCNIHRCNKIIQSKFSDINNFSNPEYITRNIEPYKTYRIGRYPKSSKDWKTYERRKEGVIWYGNWKTFWSYQHPKSWKDLSSKEISDNILNI